MNYKTITLKPGKELPVYKGHHWIFSGGIEKINSIEDGEICRIISSKGKMLGHGYFNGNTTIAVRMLNFSNLDPIDSLEKNILNAFELRKSLFKEDTNCYRLINGEGDLIPGLIADRYNNIIVIQISTKGINNIKSKIVELLINAAKKCKWEISCVYEKSSMPSRKIDGLQNFEDVLYGEYNPPIVLENNIKFLVDIKVSQKTGLFLDQREMRKLIGDISNGKNVLNCFAYTGGFSLYALKTAQKVTSVDISKNAIESLKQNIYLNNFDINKSENIAVDAFEYLHNSNLDFNLVILDPPAFAKKRSDVEKAQKAYGEINRVTLKKLPPQSMLLTCSCSFHINYEMFEKIIAKAAKDSGRSVKIIHKHRLAFDHPININHSEIDYLKSLLLFVA